MSSSDDEAPTLLPLESEQPRFVSSPGTSSLQEPAEEGHQVKAPVPVTLITGYLGAGKSTLINYILKAQHGCRCAVLLNEIGDSADVERALIKEPEGGEAAPLADWVELENGCICCSAKNDMVKALEGLMQQRDRFDYIVIETTGLANPGPVAAALWTDEELESSICLDAVVTVVDAKNIQRQLGEAPAEGAGAVNEAQQQLAFADVVLLNKVDLVSQQQLEEIQQDIAAVNTEAAVLPCHRCEVDLKHILNTGIYSGTLSPPATIAAAEETAAAAGAGAAAAAVGQSAAAAAACGAVAAVAAAGPPEGDHQEHAHSAACTHSHSEGEGPCAACGHAPLHQQGLDSSSRVCTVSLVLDLRPLDLTRLRHWLDELLWEERSAERPDVLRVKGLLWVAGSAGGSKHICQGVFDIYDVVEGPAWLPGEGRYSKLVLIGRRLDRHALQRQLEGCLAEEEAAADGSSRQERQQQQQRLRV